MRLIDADALKELAFVSGEWNSAIWSFDLPVVDVSDIDKMPTMGFEFIPATTSPEKPGHYLTISNMNWYHGGCFDEDMETGLTLSYRVAYWNNGWNDMYVIAWCELPDFPEFCKDINLKFLEVSRKNMNPVWGEKFNLR